MGFYDLYPEQGVVALGNSIITHLVSGSIPPGVHLIDGEHYFACISNPWFGLLKLT